MNPLVITQATLWPTLEIVIAFARKVLVLLLQKFRQQVAFQLRLRVLTILPARAYTACWETDHDMARAQLRIRLTLTLTQGKMNCEDETFNRRRT